MSPEEGKRSAESLPGGIDILRLRELENYFLNQIVNPHGPAISAGDIAKLTPKRATELRETLDVALAALLKPVANGDREAIAQMVQVALVRSLIP
jgi:hypothetical protein